MPAYAAAFLLTLCAAGAYFCLRMGARRNRRVLRAAGLLLLALCVVLIAYLLLTVVFVSVV